MSEPRAKACDIEIIERTRDIDPGTGIGVIVPNEVRINGSPVLVPADKDVIVHEIDMSDRNAVMVTLTLFARTVSIRAEEKEDEASE